MTEEEIQALQDAKLEAERKATEAETLAMSLKAEVEKAKGDISKVVEELTEERRKKQDALDKAKLSNGEIDVNDIIEQAFKSREEQTRKASFEEALNEFKASKQEFQADAAGLVFSKFEEGLKRFNFSDIANKDQMKARLEDVYKFMNFRPNDEGGSEYEGNSANPAPVNTVSAEPSGDVKKVLDATGVDVGKYKTLREKYPDAFNSLGLN